jgi:hypothetical protein
MDFHARGRSRKRASSELAEIESELLKNQLEAVLIGRLVEEFGLALRADATGIVFHGDRIVYHKPGAAGVRPSVLDVAKLRQIVTNLRVLEARRQQLIEQGAAHPESASTEDRTEDRAPGDFSRKLPGSPIPASAL